MIVTEYRVLVPDWVRPDQWKQVAAEMRKLGGVYSAAAKCKAWHLPGGFVFRTAEEAAVAVQRLEDLTPPRPRRATGAQPERSER